MEELNQIGYALSTQAPIHIHESTNQFIKKVTSTKRHFVG
jgi:hypothetical protein